jgi:multidrug efflux pump subunit AcrA (membrane-fusion protein)
MRYLKVSAARNPKTQAFQFWITMATPKPSFPPGLPVTVTTDLQEAGFSTETGLVLPLTALEAAAQEEAFRVWRYEDGIVNPQPVEVGRITQRGALISGGLQAGDLIVTSGLSRLSAGQAVDIQLSISNYRTRGSNSP